MIQPTNQHPHRPTLIIVMGVSGCGKSSVAKALAQMNNFTYLDADDFHSEEAKAQMAAGIPLTDEMRVPWVHNICAHLEDCANQGRSCTLAFSGLRKAHRESLRKLPFTVHFMHLEGPKSLIAARMNARADHFMPTSLLDSQFDSLEPAVNEPDIFSIDISPELPCVIAECQRHLD